MAQWWGNSLLLECWREGFPHGNLIVRDRKSTNLLRGKRVSRKGVPRESETRYEKKQDFGEAPPYQTVASSRTYALQQSEEARIHPRE